MLELDSEFPEMSNTQVSLLVDLLKTLAHPVRLRILALLRDGELCVCQITEILGIPTSTASEHLTELRRARLLVERKDGRWVYYGLQPQDGLEALLGALWPHLDEVDQIARDQATALATRVVPLEITCSKTKPCGTKALAGRSGGRAK